MPKKLFITDFDGTLLNDDKKVQSEDIQTLNQLQADNVVTAIATGRSLYSYKKAVKQMPPLPVDYLVFSTGAGILDLRTDQVIYERVLDPETVADIVLFLSRRQMDYMVLKANPDARYFYFQSFGSHNPDFQRRLRLYKPFAIPVEEQTGMAEPAVEVLVIQPAAEGRKTIKEIREAFDGLSVIQATSPLDHHSMWIEIFHPAVCKSRTTAVLTDTLGIHQADVVSVGNDFNDQDLLAWSGQAFVVDNAPSALKSTFSTVTSNNQNGVTVAAKTAGLIAG